MARHSFPRAHQVAAARIGAAQRRGDSAWGAYMRRRKGWVAQQTSYPGLVKLWRANANRVRLGLPPLPVPDTSLIRARPASQVTVQRGQSVRTDTP